MHVLRSLFHQQPLLALFATVALGYLVGKIRVRAFTLGGIAGTCWSGSSSARSG